MIASLTGKIETGFNEDIIIEVQGIGYGVLISRFDRINIKIGDEIKLYIYEHIREQSHDLYGFINIAGKTFFEQLLNVSGVGPKMAINILNIGSIEEIKKAIAQSNVIYIKQASGIGKKVAERIIVELKDKVGLVVVGENGTSFLTDNSINDDEALQGLVALGYSTNDALKALAQIDNKLSPEDRIKLALKSF